MSNEHTKNNDENNSEYSNRSVKIFKPPVREFEPNPPFFDAWDEDGNIYLDGEMLNEPVKKNRANKPEPSEPARQQTSSDELPAPPPEILDWLAQKTDYEPEEIPVTRDDLSCEETEELERFEQLEAEDGSGVSDADGIVDAPVARQRLARGFKQIPWTDFYRLESEFADFIP